MNKKDLLIKEGRVRYWEKNGKNPKRLDEDELKLGDRYNWISDEQGRFKLYDKDSGEIA
ncbi:MAG: hypothetical protein ACOCZQ_02575 [Nanoarchaeota archaeon]